MTDHGGPYPWMDIAVLDSCGAMRFALPATRPQWPVLAGPGDRLFVVEREDVTASPTEVSVYAPDGTRAVGPTPAAPPWALGADGTVYGLACDTSGLDGPAHLTAYAPDLTPRWTLELGDACPLAGPIIDAAGRLFFARFLPEKEACELVAVQTASPGLAAGPGPTRHGDDHGTMWVR